VTPINMAQLRAAFNAMNGRVKYGLGSKAASMTTPASSVSRIDCSGFVRWAAAQSTTPRLIIPDGSWHQRAWAEKNLKQVEYSTAVAARGRLFIAFMTPGVKGVGKVGHVWFVFDGKTLESYGGHGVGSRAASLYTARTHKCFEWPTTAAAIVQPQPPQAAPQPQTVEVLRSSIIVAHAVGNAWHQRRIPTLLQNGRNHPELREFLNVANIPHEIGTADDGTPFVAIGTVPK